MNGNCDCAIWGTPAIEIGRDIDGRAIDSPRVGGSYFITDMARMALERRDERLKVRLTTWLIEERRSGNQFPKISQGTIEAAEQWRDMAVADRADAILMHLAKRSETLGTRIPFRIFHNLYQVVQMDNLDETFFEFLTLSGCVGSDDLDYLLTFLESRNLLQRYGAANPEQECVLTVEGYTRLAELENSGSDSSRAFVAMWFDDSMNEAWDHGVAPAVRDAGYEPVRIDRKEHVNKIDDEIVAEIRRARFVVADFTQDNTGARGGVNYEAGFAHGLDIPVIFTCRKDRLEEVHFDTRQYNHIVWETPEELRDQLAKRIAAVLGDGPILPPDRAAG